jgi:hypothetical protein
MPLRRSRESEKFRDRGDIVGEAMWLKALLFCDGSRNEDRWLSGVIGEGMSNAGLHN